MKKKNKIISSAIIACGLVVAIAPTAITLNQQNNVHFNENLAIYTYFI